MTKNPEIRTQVPGATASSQRPSHTYTAIIRTFNSLRTTTETVASLRRQTQPPQSVIIVDSGSEAEQKAGLAALADQFIDVSDRTFNYSYSINVALPNVESTHALIISSHTWFLDDTVAQDLLNFLDDDNCAAVYCCCDDGNPSFPQWSLTRVSRLNFNSSNGLSNRCAMIPMSRLREKEAFRQDVFSCEDQVWAKSVFEDPHSYTVRVETRRCRSANPNTSLTKWANEQVALAYFVDRRRMGVPALLRRLASVVVSLLRLEWDWARIRLVVLYRLIRARRVRPNYESKYF
jgi:glycosyltransferase involved in cell wall biosynthesis